MPEKHPDHCDICRDAFNEAHKPIWVYTPTGLYLTKSIKLMEQDWLDKGLLVAYVPLTLPEPFEFEFVT